MERAWGLAVHAQGGATPRTKNTCGRAQLNPLAGMKSGRGFERSKRGTVYTFIYGVTGAHATTI